MRGAIELTFEREPEYFRGTKLAGGEDETIVAFENARLVCMGRCTRRDCWVNGVAMRVGYLAELRLDAAARGRFLIVRDGYRYFHERQLENPADLHFTSIAADNDHARRLLESGARGLPRYGFLAELDTLLIAVPRRARPANLRVGTATPERVPAILSLLNDHARRHQLAAVWTDESLRSLTAQGLPSDRILVALDGDAVVACGALWDQRAFRQTVIRGYSRALSIARPFVNAASHIFGTPRLPAAGSALAHAFLSPLAFAEGAGDLLPEFIEAFFPLAQRSGVEFLTLALPADDARLPALRRRFSTRTWRSRLYRVDWPEQPAVKVEGTFLPDVALL
ncbi:MAG: hypothetical protein ABI318_00975 [Chthoniobacteraceae bacterium]